MKIILSVFDKWRIVMPTYASVFNVIASFVLRIATRFLLKILVFTTVGFEPYFNTIFSLVISFTLTPFVMFFILYLSLFHNNWIACLEKRRFFQQLVGNHYGFHATLVDNQDQPLKPTPSFFLLCICLSL